jgi:hypothetical protein
MATLTIEPGALGARIRSDKTGGPKAVERAIFSGLQRGKAYLVGKTPVDRGILRNAWKVIRLSDGGAELVNDQPYAGIMERGARPFKISMAGIFALKGWVMRMFKSGRMIPNGAHTKIVWKKSWDKRAAIATGSSMIKRTIKKKPHNDDLEKQAEQIAYAIAKSFEKVGMKGKRFVWQSLPILAELMEKEIQRSLSTFFNRPAGK